MHVELARAAQTMTQRERTYDLTQEQGHGCDGEHAEGDGALEGESDRHGASERDLSGGDQTITDERTPASRRAGCEPEEHAASHELAAEARHDRQRNEQGQRGGFAEIDQGTRQHRQRQQDRALSRSYHRGELRASSGQRAQRETQREGGGDRREAEPGRDADREQ
jgi:hypothetical protein